MAKCKIEGFYELDKMFEQLSKPQHFQFEAVKAAAPILVKAARNAIRTTGGSEHLARSVEASEPKENQYGVYSIIKPEGRNRKKGTSYVQLAAYHEYGTVWPRKQKDADKIRHGKQKGMKKQEPHPWRDKTVNDARSKCEEAMINAVFQEVDKLI